VLVRDNRDGVQLLRSAANKTPGIKEGIPQT
jgi:hypothetical protein